MRTLMTRFVTVTAALALVAGTTVLLLQAPATAEDAAGGGWDWSALTPPADTGGTGAPEPAAADAEPAATDRSPAPTADASAAPPEPAVDSAAATTEPPAEEEAAGDPVAEAPAAGTGTEADAADAGVPAGGWDWSAFEEEEAAPRTARDDPAADDGSEESADAGGGGSGWDWGAFEADDTPVTNQGRRGRATAEKKAEKQAPRRPAEAAPDFDAPPHEGYELFAGVPEFEVIPAARDQEMHPCGNCHEWAKSDPTPRSLADPHDNFELTHGMHGKGGFWCFTCHDLSGKGGLKTLEGERLEFEEAYVLCSQCHVDQARDWAFGAHGKRVGNWQGPRKIYNCTACHYQHAPEIPLREPLGPPPARMGLARPEPPGYDGHGHEPLWQMRAASAHEGEQKEATP